DEERTQRVDARLGAQVWPEVSGSDDSPRKETQRDTDSEQGLRRHLRLPSLSKVLRPPFHGIIPDLVAILVEHQLGVLRRREPEPVGELALELARRPAGVAECDQALARTAMVADVAQDLVARRHRDAAVDVDGAGAMVFGAVDHKADIGLYRTAGEDAHLSRNRRVLLAERFQ